MAGIRALLAPVRANLHDNGRHPDDYLSPGEDSYSGGEQGVVRRDPDDEQYQP